MKRKSLIVFLSLFFFFSIAYGDEKYLLISDKATGFSYNSRLKVWEPTNFKTENKFILTKTTAEDSDIFKEFPYVIKKIGESFPCSMCKEGFNDVGIIRCNGFINFTINKDNGRFINYYAVGYYLIGLEKIGGEGVYTDEDSDTPYMEIGKLSPF